MKDSVEQLTDNIKLQAEAFLLDAGEFYPFGASISTKGVLRPLSAYSESDNPPSIELINLLESYIKRSVLDGKYLIAAIGIDVNIKENDMNIDAIEVRYFEPERVFKRYYKYQIERGSVKFDLLQTK
ncbi:hypothetical protein DYU05_17830 [Mucilaginibacter terrenus]|uniref:Uncharacterized protein n=1 Tax=Mucilaginibacter terrenus TaxID=2482727 RepID=A0A3E2NL17_9SPHI|nr:hypothetical protein [Mucilaginibacter terrenus]RFZ81685.1 hypothetical protein DYU05_17830 [Mucilaginibacter terrenus]